MKKITFLILALICSIGLLAQPMSGTYKVGTASGSDYASLSAAITDLNTKGVGGDVVLEITSDITEAANIGFGVNTNNFNVTIRPDSDADRVITFTKTTDNTSPSGHFVIGYTDLTTAWADANTIATNNVTIDGYAVGGSTKRLKFTTASGALAGSRIIVILGGSSNTVIKNCIVESKSWGSSATCVAIVPRKGTAIEVAATNVTIENNTLLSKASGTGQGIACINSGTLTTAKIQGFTATDNIIEAPGRCIWMQYINGGEIAGNTIRLAQTLSPGTINYVLWFGTGVAGAFEVYDNQFLQSLTNEATATGPFGVRTISCASGATYNIYNNVFAGLDKVKPAVGTVNLTYIFFGGTSGNISHNTFYMSKLTDVTSPGYYQAITLSFANPNITNNIFVSNEDAITNRFYATLSTGTINNNIYYLKAGTTYARITGDYSDFAAYQAANTGKDVDSKYKEVIFTSESDLNLAGTSVGDEDLGVPYIGTIGKDILGVDRNAMFAYAGAYQAALPTKTFTVTVPNGTENVYVIGGFPEKNWVAHDPYQLTPTANENEFEGTFPALSSTIYRYLCDKDPDYLEGAFDNGTLISRQTNRTFSGLPENVDIWYNMPSVKLQASFADAFGTIPQTLFVKTSQDNFASSIELTPNLTDPLNVVFETTLTNAENKIKGDVEYKYYTTEPTGVGENYETDGTSTIVVHKTTAPVLQDEIAHFAALISSLQENAAADIQIRQTTTGIEVDLEAPSLVELYTINGKLIDRATVSGTYAHDLEAGIYLIAINGKAVKFVK